MFAMPAFQPIAFATFTLVVVATPWIAAVPPAIAQTVQSQTQADGAVLQEANRLLTQGIQQYRTSQIESALRSWEQALVLYRQIKDRDSEGRVLNNLGLIYKSVSNYPKAIEYYQQSLVISRELRDRLSEARTLGNLGVIYAYLGNYPQAIEFQQKRLTVARELKDRLSEGQALGNLGLVYDSLGNYARAIEFQQQSLTIARELKDRLGEAQSLGNLGNSYKSLGNYPKAIESHQQSLAIARELKNRFGEGQTLGNLGNTYQSLGNYLKAIEFHQQSLAIARELKDRLGEERSLGNLGNAYQFLGNYAKAIEYQQQSLAIARELKDRLGIAQSLGSLGNAYQSLGNYPKAIEYLQQTLTLTRQLKDRASEGNTLGSLGVTYQSLGNFAQAIESHQQRLAIALEIKDRVGEGNALHNLGLSYQSLKDYAKAETALFSALNVRESLRPSLSDENKISLAETQINTYQLLQEVLVAQGKAEAALEVSERGRSRAFVELLSQRLQKSESPANSIAPPNLQQIRQIAKSHNATLVQYSTIWNQKLYAWVIKPTGEIAFRQVDIQAKLPDETSLAAFVRLVRSDDLGTRGLGRVAKASPQSPDGLKDLHRLLIQPIADLLPTNPADRVIFIPQGSLFLVPFAALKDSSGKYLVEQHTLLTAPSIQVLDLTRQKKAARQQVSDRLIVGNPTMPSVSLEPGEPAEQLSELPGAEAEARAIAQLLNVPMLTGDRATKATVTQKMATAKLIHLATHGLLDDRRGLGSAIALAPSGSDNGLLTAEEILNLKLNADLVVLSACDTGRGKITGDGVIGLSRSLISAGVPSVVVSLWAVPDAPTSALMTQFYQNLQQNPDKAQALRQAMLTTLKQHPNPRDWAAFTLIGEAE